MKVLQSLSILILLVGLSFFIMSCGGGDSGSVSTEDGSSSGTGDDSQCAAALLELKQVDFYNTWQPSVTVQVYEYDLACPDVSFLDPSDIAWSLDSPGYDHDAHLLLPQGRYSVCIDWWDDDEDTYLYKIYGDLPDRPLFILDENTNEIIPPEIAVSPDYPIDGIGNCPDPRDINDGGGDDSGDGGGNGSFDVTFFRNFDGSSGTDMILADIQVSGNTSYPDISWNRSDANQIQVIGDQGDLLYGIGANQNIQGNIIYLTSPIQYGDYGVSDTFRLPAYPSTSPAMTRNASYSITIGTESGPYAQLVFTVR